MVEEEENKENKEEEFDFPGTETNRENKQIDLEEFNEFFNTTENVFEQEENKGTDEPRLEDLEEPHEKMQCPTMRKI